MHKKTHPKQPASLCCVPQSPAVKTKPNTGCTLQVSEAKDSAIQDQLYEEALILHRRVRWLRSNKLLSLPHLDDG
jgi:hypothetical protein